MLFSHAAMPDIEACRISNEALLSAVRHLATISGPEGLRPVDFKNLGAEELGSIYESLLELHPNMDDGFKLETAAGHERKTTGSYYTPESLIQSLLDTALAPVLAEARKAARPEQAILDLQVCAPACGSGHFCWPPPTVWPRPRAAARTGEDEQAPEAVREAKRAIITAASTGGPEPLGRGAVQGEPVAGGHGPRQAAVLFGQPRPVRQQPAWCHACLAPRWHSGRGFQPH
jgi:hypothetical protein